MALGPISNDALSRQIARGGLRVEASALGAEALTRKAGAQAAAEEPQVGESVLDVAAPFSASSSCEEPPVAQQRTRDFFDGPLLMTPEGFTAATAERTAEGATGVPCRLSHAQHCQLQDEARLKGTQTITLRDGGGIDHVVRIHGASPVECKRVERALCDLGRCDTYGMVLPSVADVHVIDTLGTSQNGRPVLGTAVKREGGVTTISLSRLQGQGSRNPIESLDHVKRVLYHEVGHSVDTRYNLSGSAECGFGRGDSDKIGAGGDFVSRYARTNAREDYAETFSNFYTSRSSALFDGCSDADVIHMNLYGDDGSSRVSQKMAYVPRSLGPATLLKDYVMGLATNHPHYDGIGRFTRAYFGDPSVRASMVSDLAQSHPRVTPKMLDVFMERTAKLLKLDVGSVGGGNPGMPGGASPSAPGERFAL